MTHEEVMAILDRVEAALTAEDASTVRTMASTIRCLHETIQIKGISLDRVRAIAFGGVTEKTRKVCPPKEPSPKANPKPRGGSIPMASPQGWCSSGAWRR